MYDVTVILPTLNEEANIKTTIRKVFGEFYKYGINGQVLVVDDNSTDKTQEIVRELRRYMFSHLDMVVRTEDPGLSQSVIAGFRYAKSNLFIVMDADGQHPFDKIPLIHSQLTKGYDLVIGSRYMPGGGIENWTRVRKFISWGATVLARILFPTFTDPVSGFFGVKKSVVADAPLTAKGYKILMEIIGKGNWEKSVEFPYVFLDRHGGESKLKQQTIREYVDQVIDISRFAIRHPDHHAYAETKHVLKFMAVGISGIFVNMGILYALTEWAGMWYGVSSVVAIETSIITNFLLNNFWTFNDIHEEKNVFVRFGLFQFISAGGLLINFTVIFVLTSGLNVWYMTSNMIGIILAFLWNYKMNRGHTWTK